MWPRNDMPSIVITEPLLKDQRFPFFAARLRFVNLLSFGFLFFAGRGSPPPGGRSFAFSVATQTKREFLLVPE